MEQNRANTRSLFWQVNSHRMALAQEVLVAGAARDSDVTSIHVA